MTNKNLGRKVGNKHKVPKKQWNKWSNHAKRVFNDVYMALRISKQPLLIGPFAPLRPVREWQVLRWNVAWEAADAANANA